MRLPSATRAALLGGLLAALGAPSGAGAGGFYVPDGTASTVSRQRVAVAVAADRTILWEQIAYGGSPKEFAWLLATPTEPQVEVVGSSFMEWLEQTTAPVVHPPVDSAAKRQSALADDGAASGCAASEATTADLYGDEVVRVEFRGDVGPFERLTFAAWSANPEAVTAWLWRSGFTVPDGAERVIAEYVGRGWFFTALRLRGEPQEQQTVTLRLQVPGPAATLPLPLMRANAATPLEITLWVVADRRYMVGGYDNADLDESALRWYRKEGRSNYDEVFQRTIAQRGGRAFVTEYAAPLWTAGAAEADISDDAQLANAVSSDGRTYLTRLRTKTSPLAVDQDLALLPSTSPDDVSNWHNLTPAQVEAYPVGGALAPLLLLGAALAALARRRR